MPQTCFSYLRVSGKAQIEGDGFVRQRESIARYAQLHGIEIVDEFKDEGISGTKELPDREGLTDLFNRLESNHISLVLVERPDRLARDLIVGELLLQQFRDRRVKVTETEGGQDLTVLDNDPTKRLVRQLLNAIAEFDKSCLVAKLRVARDRQRRASGRCEGPRPFGTKAGEDAIVELVVGLRSQGMTLQAIAEILNGDGVPTRHGAKWSPTLIKRIVDRHSHVTNHVERGTCP